jgi:hypothetical protein
MSTPIENGSQRLQSCIIPTEEQRQEARRFDRRQAWNRAKGNLQDMLRTFDNPNNIGQFDALIQTFIHAVEERGLHQ